MDTEKEDTRLSELREALRRLPSLADTTINDSSESATPDQLSLDFSWSWSDQLSPLTTSPISGLTSDQITVLDWQSIQHPILGSSSGGAPLTISNLGFGPSTLTDLNTGSHKITLDGADADIEINGESVVGMLREIRDRLGIMKVSEEMEQEWEDLRDLRRQYEAKLAECREKSRAWDNLKNSG